MKFTLVRKEPSEAMLSNIASPSPDVDWAAALAASEAPTDAELDELCRAMWPESACWSKHYDGARQFPITASGFDVAQDLRTLDRTRMRAFLAALGDKHE